MNFWIVVIAVTLIICVIAFYPLIKKANVAQDTKRDKLNKAFYFDRLKEVEAEAQEGKIDDLEQTKRELQQSLLDDIPEQAEQSLTEKKSYGKTWFATLILLVGVASVGIYSSVGSWFSGSMLDMSHQKLDYFYERVKNEDSAPLDEAEMNQFAIALRVELQNNPKDDKSWFMLGRIGMALDNGQLALDSFQKAVDLQPDNLQYKTNLAQILMFSADPKDKEKGEEVLKQIIRVDHTNLDALGLLAFNFFEKEDYKMAATTWGMMLKIMPEDSPRRAIIERSMQSALASMKEEDKK
ncbi:c-type cytochrome biogenesis protein CcmI [Pasteurellaceae bacterium 15-036681]|nr:c-type cytochrome biogenesis protein CcmI [Pasteurellaceae bacterium 15-036681]